MAESENKNTCLKKTTQKTLFGMVQGCPPVKKPKTESERKQEYEKKRPDRHFETNWADARRHPWVFQAWGSKDNLGKPDFSNKAISPTTPMWCKYCIAPDAVISKPISPFVAGGCTNFRVGNLSVHEKTSVHVRNAAIYNREKQNESLAAQLLTSLSTVQLEELRPLFRNAHAVAKKDCSLCDFMWLNALDQVKNVKCSLHYQNEKACAEFLSAIASIEFDKFKRLVTCSKFLGIVSDGSTDVSIQEAEILYGRVCHKGVLKTHFLGIKNVYRGNAEEIHQAIIEVLDRTLSDEHDCETSKPLWKSKLVAFGSDGASVMTGSENGVARRMADTVGHSIEAIHCCGHRLELSFKQAVKSMALWDTAQTALSELFTFYHKSPLRRSQLKQVFHRLNKSARMPTRIGGTRWLPHILLALDNLFFSYDVIIAHLEETSKADTSRDKANDKARNLLAHLTNKGILLMLSFMHDIVETLSKFSLALQSADATIATTAQQLQFAIVQLEKYKTEDGLRFSKEKEKLSRTTGDSLSSVGLPKTRSGSLQFTDNLRQDFCNKAISSLKQKFECDRALLDGAYMLDLSSWPLPDQLMLGSENFTFGDETVKSLIFAYEDLLSVSGVKVEAILPEFTSLKLSLNTANVKVQNMSLSQLNERYAKFEIFLSLLDLLGTFPATSVDAERGFSHVKRIKTDIRNRLNDKSLSDILCVKLHSDNIGNFDPDQSIMTWNGVKERRVRRELNVFKDLNCIKNSDTSSSSDSD